MNQPRRAALQMLPYILFACPGLPSGHSVFPFTISRYLSALLLSSLLHIVYQVPTATGDLLLFSVAQWLDFVHQSSSLLSSSQLYAAPSNEHSPTISDIYSTCLSCFAPPKRLTESPDLNHSMLKPHQPASRAHTHTHIRNRCTLGCALSVLLRTYLPLSLYSHSSLRTTDLQEERWACEI